MPVKKEPSGRRSVQAEVEVPGTPEEVWRAIATGPGISSWFVPTRLEEREGGVVESNFGPNMESRETITAWDPPRRYAAGSPNAEGAAGPSVATEWVVEAGSGGTCVVRVVHSWFASSDDWDDQFEQHEYGWRSFFRLLRLALTHFRGQPSALIQLVHVAPPPKAAAWSTLMRGLGLETRELGARVSTRAGAPRLVGQIEHFGTGDFAEELVLRLEEPAPGFVHFFAMPMGEIVVLPIRLYLFGDRAKEIALRDEALWRSWIERTFAKA